MGVFDTIPSFTPEIKTVVIDVDGTNTVVRAHVVLKGGDKTLKLAWGDLSTETKGHLTPLKDLLKADWIAKEQAEE